MEIISFEEFSKVEIKMGKIVAAEKVEGSDKLLKFQVEFASPFIKGRGPRSGEGFQNPPSPSDHPPFQKEESETRTIVSGVAKVYQPEQMLGKLVPVVMNLAPRMIKGIESQGMIIYAIDETPADGNPAHRPVMLNPERDLPNGSSVQ